MSIACSHAGSRILLAFLGLLFACAGPVSAAAIVSGFDGSTLPPNDDSSTTAVPLGFEIDAFGTRFSSVFVNNNGNVTLDQPLSAFTPFNLLSTDRLVIAPFFADVDTSAAGNPVTYGAGSFEGRRAFGVNWINVDYFSSSPNHIHRNSFQLILVSRSDRGDGDFDIVFNYDQIQWEAGRASGSDEGGLGGFSARAGYALGRGAPGSAFELAGSALPGSFIDRGSRSLVAGNRGSSIAGRYVFEIRSSDRSTQVSALTPFANGPAYAAASNAQGNLVVFESTATNLVGANGFQSGDRNIYLIDTRTGLIQPINVDTNEVPIAGGAREPAIAPDGSAVLFVAPDASIGALLGESSAKRAARQKQGGSSVLLRNMLTGTTQRIGGGTSDGAGTVPQISPDGQSIVFTGSVTQPGEGAVGQRNVYRATLSRTGDVYSAGVPVCLSCKSVAANGSNTATNSNGDSGKPVVSANGEWAAWETTAKNAVAATASPCTNAGTDVILRNLVTGVAQRVGVPSSASGCAAAASSGARNPQLDGDGDQIVFESDHALTGGDSNATSDVFLASTAGGTPTRLSVGSGGAGANGASSQPVISGDGTMVAFVSTASNLDATAADTNGVADIHVRPVDSSTVLRLSRTDSGAQADGPSERPKLSFDGALLVFQSSASNLAPGAVGGQVGVFQRTNPLAVQNRSATWWKADESGWGVFTVDQGSFLGIGWFTYDSDGEPVWFIGAATKQANGSYVGEVSRFTGVPLAQISGVASETNTKFADVTLSFQGDTGMTFQYAVVGGVSQTKSTTRFPYASRDIVCRNSPTASRATADNYSDLWWGGIQTTGWGIFVNHTEDGLFPIWYTYDTDREALFIVGVATPQADGSFAGQLFRQRNGTPYNLINGAAPSSGSDPIGTFTFRPIDGQTADFGYTIGGVTQTKRISRYQFGDTATVCDTQSFGTLSVKHAAEDAEQQDMKRKHEQAAADRGD